MHALDAGGMRFESLTCRILPKIILLSGYTCVRGSKGAMGSIGCIGHLTRGWPLDQAGLGQVRVMRVRVRFAEVLQVLKRSVSNHLSQMPIKEAGRVSFAHNREN